MTYGEGSRVEGNGLDGRVDVISTSDTVRGQEGDNIIGCHTSSILESREDTIESIIGLRDETIGRDLLGVRTASKELELRSTRALGETDSTGELDEISCGDVVGGHEGSKEIDSIVDTEIGVEVGFDIREEEGRPVSTLATVKIP